jgi:hypothetical protein
MATPLIKLGICEPVIEFFRPDFSIDQNGNIVFDYGDDKFELFGINKHIVPKLCQPWVTHKLDIPAITDVYIFESAIEAMCFTQCNWSKMREQGFIKALFLSIGALTLPHVTEWISESLRGKRFHFVFSNALLGRVMDCRMAARLANKTIRVTHYDEIVFAEFAGYTYQFKEDDFTLSAFKKASGFYYKNARTHKPPSPHKSYKDLLKSLNQI